MRTIAAAASSPPKRANKDWGSIPTGTAMTEVPCEPIVKRRLDAGRLLGLLPLVAGGGLTGAQPRSRTHAAAK
jgi:hypothetical protein